jgi:hypothetical protein
LIEKLNVELTQTNDTPASKPLYHSLSWREFLSYAKQQGINTKGKTRGEIELELLNQSQN